jgi:hypothetical protein
MGGKVKVLEQEKTCFVLDKNEWVEADYIGVFQFSNVIDPSPMVGGHKSGVIAYPVVVVKLNDKLQNFILQKVKFSI